MRIKELLHIEHLYVLGHLNDLRQYRKPQFANEAMVAQRCVYFLDTPSYGNLGDQAIAFAMRKFIESILPGYKQFEVQENVIAKHFRWLKKNIKKEDVICLTGGQYGSLLP